MRALIFKLMAGLLGLATASVAASPFVGMWEGKLNDLPGVELKIDGSGQKISGRIAFFFQKRGDDGKWRVEGDKTELPMLAPKLDGKILSFEVIHYKTHGSKELGPNAKFRMELTGSDSAKLVKVEGEDQASDSVMLARRK
jgi:hypothetical protein